MYLLVTQTQWDYFKKLLDSCVDARIILQLEDLLTWDQRDGVYPGCIKWRGAKWEEITYWPKELRVAVCAGGNSEWGNLLWDKHLDELYIMLDSGVDLNLDGIDRDYPDTTGLSRP